MQKRRSNYELKIRIEGDRSLPVEAAARRIVDFARQEGWGARGPIPLEKQVTFTAVNDAAEATHVGRQRIRQRTRTQNGEKRIERSIRGEVHARLVFITLPTYAALTHLERVILPSDVRVVTSYGEKKGALPQTPREVLSQL